MSYLCRENLRRTIRVERALGRAWLHYDRAMAPTGDPQPWLRRTRLDVAEAIESLPPPVSERDCAWRALQEECARLAAAGAEDFTPAAVQAALSAVSAYWRAVRRPTFRWWGLAAGLLLCGLLVLTGAGYVAQRLLTRDGFRVSYYAGSPFERPLFLWSERRAEKDYALKAPMRWMPRDGWSAQWTGILHVPETADYAFYAQALDGVRLYIDDEIVIDHWEAPGWAPGKHGARRLDKGAHPVRIEHRDGTGPAAVRVRWTGGGIPANTVLGSPHVTKQ